MKLRDLILVITIIYTICNSATGQSLDTLPSNKTELKFFEPSPSFSKKRFNTTLGVGIASYTGTSIALFNVWYKNYEQGSFHFFNDLGEWKNMDKAGHIYSGYFQTMLAYKAGKWTGLNQDKSLLTGAITAGVFQTTLEVMDGFSEKWGFSGPDFVSNIVGIGAFYVQQKYWGEQSIIIKQSSFPRTHGFTDDNCSFCPQIAQERATDLFGTSWLERGLKDYNYQSYWLSIDINSIANQQIQWPKWLNVAVGYGAKNLYGGYSNKWAENNQIIDLSNRKRTSRYLLSLDVNFDKIGTRSPFLRTLFTFLNTRKVPSPTIEYNKLDGFVFHLMFL